MANHIITLFEEECVRRDDDIEFDISFLKTTINVFLNNFTGTHKEALEGVFGFLVRRTLMEHWDRAYTESLVSQLTPFCEKLQVFTLQNIKSLKTAIDKKAETLRTLWVSVLRLSAGESYAGAGFDRQIKQIYIPVFQSRALDLSNVYCAADSLHAYLILVSTYKFNACSRLLEHCESQSVKFGTQRISATFHHVFEDHCISDLSFANKIVDIVRGYYKEQLD
jgi:hypothetical protein